jgi:hypothetical protein
MARDLGCRPSRRERGPRHNERTQHCGKDRDTEDLRPATRDFANPRTDTAYNKVKRGWLRNRGAVQPRCTVSCLVTRDLIRRPSTPRKLGPNEVAVETGRSPAA